jgi:hypothetical protein
MRRRDFITLIGGAAFSLPLTVRAQQRPIVKRVGMLVPFPNDRDPLVIEYLLAFKQRLHELGWDEGRNIQFEYRFTGQVPQRIRDGAAELVSLAPDTVVVWAILLLQSCGGQRKRSLSFSSSCPIRSAPALLRTWHIREETLLASEILRPI